MKADQSTLALAALPMNKFSLTLARVPFLLHTYLLGRTAIKQAVSYESSPSLHIEEARLVECPSGPSPGEFLMVFLTPEAQSFFINGIALCDASEKN